MATGGEEREGTRGLGTYLFLAITVPSLIYYGLFLAGYRFSVDSWPLLHSVEKLLSEPGLSLLNGREFNGYDNYWPGVILSSLAASIATGLGPHAAFFAATWGAVLVALVLVLALFPGRGFSPLLVVLTPVVFFFMASPLKEPYSYPLVYLLLYLALRRASLAAYLILGAGLAEAHPVMPLVAMAVLAAYTVLSRGGGSLAPWRGAGGGDSAPKALLVLASIYAVYLLLVGRAARLPWPRLGLGDAAAYATYLATFLAIALLSYSREPRVRGRRIGKGAALLASLAIYAVLAAGYLRGERGLLLALYTVPVLVEAVAAATGPAMRGRMRYLLDSLILVTGVDTLYTIVYLRAETLAHRAANHLVQALALSASTRKRVARIAVLIAVAASAALALFIAVKGVYALDPTWVYREGLVEQYGLVLPHLPRGVTVLGGAETSYYYQVIAKAEMVNPVSVRLHGLRLGKNQVLVLTRIDEAFGLIAHGVAAPPGTYTGGLRGLGLVYSSGSMSIYVAADG